MPPDQDGIIVVPDDPGWPAAFDAEAIRLRAALGALALRVDHHGSTAIPGLSAKPIIDIQVSNESLRWRYRAGIRATSSKPREQDGRATEKTSGSVVKVRERLQKVYESGEDYLFAKSQFAFVDLPENVRRKILALEKAG
ncbi:MAG TPA: GrpB family protein [Vicinamibacterales bacterium]|nr:GrpB family protein [Vicinamibacterales bacterium]